MDSSVVIKTVPLNKMALNAQKLQTVVDSFSDPNSEALLALLSGQLVEQDD